MFSLRHSSIVEREEGKVEVIVNPTVLSKLFNNSD